MQCGRVSSNVEVIRGTALTPSSTVPGSSMHYQQVIGTPRYEDFEIEYVESNPWAHLGMGWTIETRKGPKEADCSPYLNLKNIDPKWYEAIGGDAAELQKQVNGQKSEN